MLSVQKHMHNLVLIFRTIMYRKRTTVFKLFAVWETLS